MVERWTFAFCFVYALFIISPLILLRIAGIQTATEIDSSFLSGFITASGIFAGFLASSAISRREALDLRHYLMLLANLGVFFIVLNMIFLKHLILVGRPDLLDFAFVMISVNTNAFTAIIIATTLFIHEFIERAQQLIRQIRRAKG
jgi:hypothetical protein